MTKRMIDADAVLTFLTPILQENEKARMTCNNIQFISYDTKVDLVKKVIAEIEKLILKSVDIETECPVIPVQDMGDINV